MALVEFTRMLFNYLEKKKLKAWNQEAGLVTTSIFAILVTIYTILASISTIPTAFMPICRT